MAVTAAIQLGWLGTRGYAEVATRCAQGAHYLHDYLIQVSGVTPVSTNPFFREFAVRLPRNASGVLDDLVGEGILGGLSVESLAGDSDPSIEGDISDVALIAVTERRTREELNHYVDVLAKVLS
jgi:glycine dehydrogenase subunit 1